MASGVLVTNVIEEKSKKIEPLVRPAWQKHFTPEQWENLGQENRENFVLKHMLAEMIVDTSTCLENCV